MKSILISIKPQYVADILNGYKTIEIRKTKPKCELPCKVYIYCTKGKPYLYRVNDKCKAENIIAESIVGKGAKVAVPKKEQWYLEQAEKEVKGE